MPCNLAVSITKAAVTNEMLLALLTPQVVEPVLQAYLDQHNDQFGPFHIKTHTLVKQLIVWVGEREVSIQEGRVRVTDYAGDEVLTTRLTEELSQLLTSLADRLFEQAIGQALGTQMINAQEVQVAGADQKPTRAVVYTVSM